MAAVTHGITLAVTTNAETYTTASFTPAADDLLYLMLIATGTTLDGVISDSQGLGWTEIEGVSGANRNAIYIANALSANAAMTVTADFTGDAATGCLMFVARVSGMKLAGINAIRQRKTRIAGAAGSTPEIIFNENVLTENPTIGFVRNSTNPPALTPPTGWAEETADSDTGYPTPATGGEYVTRDSGFTGTTMTWGNTSPTAFNIFSVEFDTSAEENYLRSMFAFP